MDADSSCKDGWCAEPQPRAVKRRRSGTGRRCHAAATLFLLLIFLCAPACATDGDPWAPFNTPWFDQVAVSDGLPYSITTAVAQDQDGLIWIGTMSGLVRYDGYRMQVFGTRAEDTPGLPDAYVRRLLALPDGTLLVGTDAGGLARFNPLDNKFHLYPIGANGIGDGKIYDLADDHGGGVWIATETGLSHLDLRTGVINQLNTGPQTAPRNFSVLQDREGNLWLGNDKGLFVRRKGNDAFAPLTTTNRTVATVLANQIWSIAQDSEGRLWAGSGQVGAAYRDTAGHWHGVPGFSGHQDDMLLPTVRDFLQLDTGEMWIATDGGGVMEYSPGNPKFRTITHDQAMPSSLPGNSVRALLQDRSGNVWVATDLGLARNNPHARTAFSLLPSPLQEHTLADATVRAIFVDSRGRIWLGLSAGHVDLIDLQAGTLRHLDLGRSRAQRGVFSITEAADGSIWIGAQGLARVDPDTLVIQDVWLPALHDTPVLSLQAEGSRLLIGTYNGLYRYDIHSHAIDHVSHVPGVPNSLASNTVRQIARIGNAWWYGTTRGISIDRGNGNQRYFENLRHEASDPDSLPQDNIRGISSDRKGRVWVSTFSGLAVLDNHAAGEPWRFRTIGMADGLSSDKVISVLADDSDRLWASVSNGVARIDSDTHTIVNLGARDGLHVTSYANSAAARAPGGELLFGGLGGLTVIRPHWQPPAMPPAPLAVTGAIVNGAPLPFGKLPTEGTTIEVGKGNHNLRLDFALLDYQAPKETTYSYRMDGLDEDWTRIPKGSLPSAIYTNLPHGKYRLRLRVGTYGMKPRTFETDLAVVVNPRWYETMFSQFVGALLLTGFIVLLVHLRTLYLRRKAKELQRQIDAHTRDLLNANQRLDELANIDGLTGIYNRRRFLELAGEALGHIRHAPLCIALFDLDRFKLINDTYGHLAGDEVIRGTIGVIRQHCRQRDLLGRYGGEEFVLCLTETSLAQAQEVIERICTALACTRVIYEGQSIAVTASIGLAALRPGESIEIWLSRADKALYEAKRAGRNRFATAD